MCLWIERRTCNWNESQEKLAQNVVKTATTKLFSRNLGMQELPFFVAWIRELCFLLCETENYVLGCMKSWNDFFLSSLNGLFLLHEIKLQFFLAWKHEKKKKICSVFKPFVLLLLISKNLVSFSFLDHKNYGSFRFNYKLLRCSITSNIQNTKENNNNVPKTLNGSEGSIFDKKYQPIQLLDWGSNHLSCNAYVIVTLTWIY